MATPREVLDRTSPMLALAESMDAVTPGAAGLAYQAAELAVHVMMMELDGSNPWEDDRRYRRASELLSISEDEFAFIHQVRQRDFYANASFIITEHGRAWGPPLEIPSDDDCRRCVLTALRIVDAVHAKVVAL